MTGIRNSRRPDQRHGAGGETPPFSRLPQLRCGQDPRVPTSAPTCPCASGLLGGGRRGGSSPRPALLKAVEGFPRCPGSPGTWDSGFSRARHLREEGGGHRARFQPELAGPMPLRQISPVPLWLPPSWSHPGHLPPPPGLAPSAQPAFSNRTPQHVLLSLRNGSAVTLISAGFETRGRKPSQDRLLVVQLRSLLHS